MVTGLWGWLRKTADRKNAKHVFLFFFCCAAGLYAGLLDNQRISQTGADAFRAGDYARAVEELKKESPIADSGFHAFALGCAYMGLNDLTNALNCFRACADRFGRWSSFAYEKMGDISLAQERLDNALNAYRLAANQTKLGPYGDLLYSKIKRIVREKGKELPSIPWIEEFQEVEKAPPPVFADTLIQMIKDTLFKAVDSLILKRVDPAAYDAKICSLCSLLPQDSARDTLFTTKTLFALSKLAVSCRQYRTALSWMDKASVRANFEDEVPRQQYVYARASLFFKMERYNEAIEWGEKYSKKFNPDASVLYLLARSYRSLGKADKADYWYKKHVEYFPHLEKSIDIVWMLAWQKEEISDFAEARKLYKKLFSIRKDRQKADAACYRCALTYCKERNYKTALESFKFFLDKFSASDWAIAARFWNARCYFSLGQFESARKECAIVLKTAPTDYYAFRARDLLALMGDSLQPLPVDTTFTVERTITWLDSMSGANKKTLSSEDSAGFSMAVSLASLGMMNYSVYYLQPMEDNYSDNFTIQYELARLYALNNEPAAAFRVIRRFAWRVPPAGDQQALPGSLYLLLYPGFYFPIIKSAAAANGVEPEFVSSIIRQESIFNAKIVSPAGAVGLMQIMPYTGQEIANDLKEKFCIDSLSSPSFSIRYGTYYIKKLLNRFNGNMVLAIAAYNGGPHNARKWNALNSDDGFDMFIEDIGYSETCKYTKKVLGNYWTYKELIKRGLYTKQ